MMEKEKFSFLITNITAVLHNYLQLAKQSGTITIKLDAVNGDVVDCTVTNSLRLNLQGLQDGKGATTVQGKPGTERIRRPGEDKVLSGRRTG
jgi:hypothetical protein